MANRKRKGERADGLIQVTLDIGYDENGKRIRKSFYGHSRTEAERKRDEFKAAMSKNTKYSNDITVSEWVKIYKETYRQKVDEAYLNNDNVPYNRLVDQLGYMAVATVTESDLQSALNKLKGTSFSNCDKYRQCMKRVFEKARKNKIITDNPAEDLVMPQYTKGTHRALETWEIKLILDHWNEPGLHAGLWIMLMMLAGLRRGEMIALNWSAIDMDNKLLTVCQTAVIKTNQSEIVKRAKTDAGLRTIPICRPLYDALSSVPKVKRKGLVCLSAHGKQLTDSSVSRGIETFCNAMERILNGEPMFQRGKRNDIIKRETDKNRIRFAFRVHDLRHTFCTLLYVRGIDLKSAQYFMGHADINTTLNIYTHLSKEKIAESNGIILGDFVGFETKQNHSKDEGGNLVVYNVMQNSQMP